MPWHTRVRRAKGVTSTVSVNTRISAEKLQQMVDALRCGAVHACRHMPCMAV